MTLFFVAVPLFLLWLLYSDAPETTTAQYLGIKWLHFCFRFINKDISLNSPTVLYPSSLPPTGKKMCDLSLTKGHG